MTAKIIYLGDLRTESVHLRSGDKVINDAPTDNHGKGAAFSPTDMLATSLGTCMLTIMGIAAQKQGLDVDGATAEITKVMASGPRRVAEIQVEIGMPHNRYTEEARKLLEEKAVNCPVAKSLHPDIRQEVRFSYSQEA